MGIGKISFNDNKVIGTIDSDNDNVIAMKCEIHLPEAYAEMFKKGTKIEGKKYVTMKMEGTTLKLDVDTDLDGEKVLGLEANLFECFDEGANLVSGDDAPEAPSAEETDSNQ